MNKSNVLLLGFTIPDALAQQIFSVDTSPAVQTHKFAWSLARALKSGFAKIILVSSSPIQNFPLGRKLLFRGRGFQEGGIEGSLLGFVNLLVLKHVTRFFACALTVPRMLRVHNIELVFVHGIHTPFLLFGVLTRLFGKKLVVVLTDPPGVERSTDSQLARFLKKVDRWLVTTILKRADAVIALAPELVKSFSVNKPSLVFPGILDSTLARLISNVHQNERRSDRPFTIAYAGGLNAAYGVDRLVDAVLGLNGVDVRLKLFGRGDQEARIRELATTDRRIEYGGFLGNDELIPELLGADLLINPRPTQETFAVMSFPSKLIEYLALAKPVLTTRISSIPDSYKPHFFFIDDESAEGIGVAILELMKLRPEDRETHALRAQRFIEAEASEVAIGEKIAHLCR